MSEYSTVPPAEAVASGAQLLDEKMPGWYNRIAKSKLRTNTSTNCICAQLSDNGEWYTTAKKLGGNWQDASWSEWVFNHGFAGGPNYDAEWKLAIDARRQADKLGVAAQEKKEMVPA